MRRIFKIMILLLSPWLFTNEVDAQWVQQKSGTVDVLTDVVMLDSTTAIAVGYNNTILRTTNSGEEWIRSAPPIITLITNWNAISFFDTHNGIIAGDNMVASTTTGGESWSYYSRPGKGKCFSALQIGPAAMYVGDDSGWVHKSIDTGKTWSSEKISTDPIHSLFAWSGAFIMGLPLYALTPQLLFTKLEFPPSGWNEIRIPFYGLGSGAFSGEFCNGGGSGFIVGVQGDFVAAPTIARKLALDSIWRVLETGIPFDGTLLGVSAPSEKVIYVCGSGGMMYKSTDEGDSWDVSLIPTNLSLTSVCFFNEKRGFAVGDSGSIFFTSNGATGVNEPGNSLPLEMKLSQNFPNPFNPSTSIQFELSRASTVHLKILNILGQEIAAILDGHLAAGTHTVQWDAQAFASGIDFYRLQAGATSSTKKMLLMK
jgi:hypothetical protein